MPIQTAEQAQNVHGVVPAAVGSYGGGEDFGSPFGGGAGSPPGTTNEAAVPYGGPPSAYPPPGGGNGGDGGPGVSTDIGSGSGSGSKPSPLSLDQIRLFNEITGAGVDVLGTHGGVHNLWAKSRAGLTQDDAYTMETLEELDKNPEYNENYKVNTDMFRPEINPDPDAAQDGTWQSPELDLLGGKVGLQQGALTYTRPSGTQFYGSGNFNDGNLGFTVGAKFPLQRNAQGGPVGLMSLPQGYANGGGVDPSDWRVLEQIIAAGGNPEDYGYENGGEVIEGTDTMEELTPFGGTRERVMDQVEAFDNAPHHIEEPMVGMYGEKVPLSIARRVQGYMEGLDPVKRNLIQEMMQMFRMKKMQEKQQDQDQSGQFFGPQPNEYSI